MWLSAKKRRFEEGAIVAINEADFYTLDTALSRLLRHYGWAEDVDQPLEIRRMRVLERVLEPTQGSLSKKR
jgi:hypothetical protein